MTRRRVVCVCSHESEVTSDEQRRQLGWRLVQVTAEPRLAGESSAEVFVWVCPPCASLRNAQLRAS